MTIATRVPFSPDDFAEFLDAHDDFHLVGHGPAGRVEAQRSTRDPYTVTVIRRGNQLYFADFTFGTPEGTEYKDGVYQPIPTGLEGPPDEPGNDFEGRTTNE